jgi:carbamoyltransferase
MNILGISCFYHDAAAALIVNGSVVAAVEEERLTRKKHDPSFPSMAIEYCLSQAGIRVEDLDAVVFYEKPIRKFIRILNSTLQNAPRSYPVFLNAMHDWLGDKLWVKNTIVAELHVSPEKIFFCDHHLAHAASSFFASPFERAAIVTVDGVGEDTTTIIARGDGALIESVVSKSFPHSIGLLYSVFTAFLGFEVNEGEYKVMGLAAYGEPTYVDKVRTLITQADDGSYCINEEYFAFTTSVEYGFNNKFLELFGVPRSPERDFVTKRMDLSLQEQFTDEDLEKNQYYADVAASIQVVVEEMVLKIVKHALRITGESNLCFAGGVALNSVANGRILRESGFSNVFIQSAAGDAGGALGSALWASRTLFQDSRSNVVLPTYLGPSYGSKEIEEAIRNAQLSYERVDHDEDELANRISTFLAEGKVVGLFQGRCEWGPRALGNRSIIADPRNPDMRDIVNTKVKFREPFRPFAPVVLAESAKEFFELGGEAYENLTRYMLLTTNVKKEKMNDIPACTHINGTARVQTVTPDDNSRFYNVIKSFEDKTSVPVILNTSFNLRGEPIVTSPRDAIKTFLASGIDVLVLENYILKKT